MAARNAHIDGCSGSARFRLSLVWLFRVHPRRSTGAAPPNPGAWCEATGPEAPRRATTESTAGLLARGSPPVTAFPGIGPSGNVARARRLQLRGRVRLWDLGPHRSPLCRPDERPPIG